MDRENMETHLEGIRRLLNHLHGEVTALEENYSQVLLVLRRLEGTSLSDDLSGLLRRRPFFDRWQELLDECQRLGQPGGLLLVDIDHFKKVNDTHGHPTGDEVIKRVASLLKQYESSSCVVGRYGGEEFAVAARGSDAELLGLAEFIRRGAERLHGPVIGRDGKAVPGVVWKCTLSVGMASTSKIGFDARQILRAADDALYEAKRRGRNQVRAA